MITTKTNRPHLSEIENGWQKFWKTFWNGEKPKINEDYCLKGRVSPELKRKITINLKNIIAQSSKYKIGKTGDAYIRTDKNDYRNGYNKMYLIFKSKSDSIVSELEENYIAKFIEDEKNDNKRVKSPGKGMYSYDGYYYLYIVTN